MRYLGGKAKIAKHIGALVNQHISPETVYVEPFVGGCNVPPVIQANRMILADAHPQLIALYQAVRDGWDPPGEVSEDLYRVVKNSRGYFLPELVGFVGFTSFGGKYFGGYPRSAVDIDYYGSARRTLLKIRPTLQKADLYCCDYKQVPIPRGAVVYCDPPYAGTTGYSKGLDHAEFWEWVRWVSGFATVFVSEYQAPGDFAEVLRVERNKEIRSPKAKTVIEKVFMYSPPT